MLNMRKIFCLLLGFISLIYACSDLEYSKLVDEGERKYSGKDYYGAIEAYNKAIELDPNHPVAYYLRGDAKKMLSDEEGALSDYNKSIELYNGNPDVFFSRGILRQEIFDYNGAREDFTEAIELLPHSAGYTSSYLAVLYYHRALLYLRIADFWEMLDAISNRANTQDISEEDLSKLSEATDSLYSRNFQNTIDAIIKLEEIIGKSEIVNGVFEEYDEQLKTENGLFEHLKAEVETGAGIIQESYVSALRDLNEAIELEPEDGTYYYARGIAKTGLKDYYSALSDFKMALELQKDDSIIQRYDIYYEIGLIKVEMNNAEEGCRFFKMAIEKGHWDKGIISRYCGSDLN